MNYRWIPIDNQLIKEQLKIIKTKGLLILIYLLIESTTRNYCKTSINDIKQNCNIKDIRTVKKYLQLLIENNLILINTDIELINQNNLITITLLYKNNLKKFYKLPINIFEKYLTKIGDIGISLYCIIIIFTNKKLNYAYPGNELLKKILDLTNTNTLDKYIKILEENELIVSEYGEKKQKDNKWISEKRKFFVKKI